MAISGLKTWVTGDSLTAANLNTDKSILEAKFSGNITTADLSSSAAITNTQLANSHYEIVLNMITDGVRWAAAGVGEIVAMAGFPGDVNAESYTIVQIDFAITCPATAITVAPAFNIEWGYFGSDTPWNLTTAIKNSASIGTITAGQGRCEQITGHATTIALSTTNKNVFGIEKQTAGTGWTAADQVLCVSLKLKRTDGLRS